MRLTRTPILATLAALSLAAVLGTRPARSQATPPATPAAPAVPASPATPATPPSPVSSIRNKLSAGDLYSAESILEVHRAKVGADGAWLAGLGWLARGAMLLGDLEKAERYAAEVRDTCAQRMARGIKLAQDRDLEGALGAAIEVEAQRLDRTFGRPAAVAWLRGEIARMQGPPAFRSRLHKRLNLLTLTGRPAPELAVEGHLGEAPPKLASLRGKPVVLFLWAEWCADCKAQAESLARVLKRHALEDLRCVAVTRWYDDEPQRAKETARVDSVWTAVYSEVGPIPRVFSTASMVEYGGSATPTFVFVDRMGIVRRYTATRLSEEELERGVAEILK